MTTTEAIKQLQTEHDLIAGERDLDGSQFAPALLETLAMAIEVLKCSEIPNCSEPKCADGCIYGWGSSECGHCDYRSEEPKTGDCISRQDAIDALKGLPTWWADSGGYYGGAQPPMEALLDPEDAISALENIPPAQQEQHWIPCTKKAHPDTPFRVQVQMDNGWIITAYYQDGEWLSVPDCGKPLLDKWIEAWRELPEPYQESEQDEH